MAVSVAYSFSGRRSLLWIERIGGGIGSSGASCRRKSEVGRLLSALASLTATLGNRIQELVLVLRSWDVAERRVWREMRCFCLELGMDR